MIKYTSIHMLASNMDTLNFPHKDELTEIIPLLKLMEKINPCNQQYELIDDTLVISYDLNINLFNFRKFPPLKINVQIIGLPISVSLKGYLGNSHKVEKIIKEKKGLKVLLNSDTPFNGGAKTLSTFVFENKFTSFEEYLNSLRSPYRRRINQALKYKEKIAARKINNEEFSLEHYNLYLSVMNRTNHPLEILPMEFFKEYNADLYEFVDNKTNEILGFVQVKEKKNKLYFLFGGFRKEDIKKYDIYYNMLLKIIELGIERNVLEIEFGQTAEESKLKIGCNEKFKYLYIHHSNYIINFFLQRLVPYFSYKPYPIKHHVFKVIIYDSIFKKS